MEEIQVSIIALYIIFFASTSSNTRFCAPQEEERRHLLSFASEERKMHFICLEIFFVTHQLQAVKIAAKVSMEKCPKKTLSSRQRWNGNKFFLSFFFSIISEPEENSRDVVILAARAVISPSPVNRQTNSTNFSFSELLMVAFKIIFLLYLHETMILIMGIKSCNTFNI